MARYLIAGRCQQTCHHRTSLNRALTAWIQTDWKRRLRKYFTLRLTLDERYRSFERWQPILAGREMPLRRRINARNVDETKNKLQHHLSILRQTFVYKFPTSWAPLRMLYAEWAELSLQRHTHWMAQSAARWQHLVERHASRKLLDWDFLTCNRPANEISFVAVG